MRREVIGGGMSGSDGVGERCVRGWRGSISVANVYI